MQINLVQSSTVNYFRNYCCYYLLGCQLAIINGSISSSKSLKTNNVNPVSEHILLVIIMLFL